jgi:hypothetical protein
MAEERAMTKAAEQRVSPERPAGEVIAFPPVTTEASGLQAAAARLRDFFEGRASFAQLMAALVAPFNASPLDEAADAAEGPVDPPLLR